jgi:hypothetical protein
MEDNDEEGFFSYSIDYGVLEEAFTMLILDSNLMYEYSDEGNLLFHQACAENDLRIVKYIIMMGFDIHTPNEFGETGMDIAEDFENYEVLNFMEKYIRSSEIETN